MVGWLSSWIVGRLDGKVANGPIAFKLKNAKEILSIFDELVICMSKELFMDEYMRYDCRGGVSCTTVLRAVHTHLSAMLTSTY